MIAGGREAQSLPSPDSLGEGAYKDGDFIKAMDMIERLDLLEPNDYSPEQKLRWLSELDGKL